MGVMRLLRLKNFRNVPIHRFGKFPPRSVSFGGVCDCLFQFFDRNGKFNKNIISNGVFLCPNFFPITIIAFQFHRNNAGDGNKVPRADTYIVLYGLSGGGKPFPYTGRNILLRLNGCFQTRQRGTGFPVDIRASDEMSNLIFFEIKIRIFFFGPIRSAGKTVSPLQYRVSGRRAGGNKNG